MKKKNADRATREDLSVLHAFFPSRAEAVVSVLKRRNKKAKKIEQWREDQLVAFVKAINQEASGLQRAFREKRISTLAWAARNLLELSIWVEYCNASYDNAARFREDAVRDLYGISIAVQQLELMLGGSESEDLNNKQDALSKFARSRGISSLDDDYKRVLDAAKEIGQGEYFRGLNKLLSKLAHPTAWAVATIDSVNADEAFRGMFLKDGVNLAVLSLTAIRNHILSIYPTAGHR